MKTNSGKLFTPNGLDANEHNIVHFHLSCAEISCCWHRKMSITLSTFIYHVLKFRVAGIEKNKEK
ncbi:hypothetical protein [Salirhabdus salicampi]|uniref:hypothetical protein n=1 Tax=Salirhabdus salicampi TaxID=476102 RepID=UPI0020C50FA9|nr:hypothetical protein [Salirhabdus salicampi]MCP8616396.1 hypothetical protein [Salirhabdus salicampi]